MRTNHDKRVLALNANFTPIATISWRRAIVLSIINEENPNKGLEIVDYYDDYILTCGNKHVPMPAVVRSPVYLKQDKRKVSFSRKHVFLRDQMTCCYCGHQDLSAESLTYDHVIPRVVWKKLKYVGTPTHWKNIVTCCKPCNRKKADRDLKDCGMRLLKEPVEPKPAQFVLGISPWSKIPPQWEIYMPPLYKHLIEKRAETVNR
jgi:5-methylcytosine-specific restriction endonuclease McrA